MRICPSILNADRNNLMSEIEKVANHKKMSVSKLIRSYIKEGMKRDHELTNQEDKDFRVE